MFLMKEYHLLNIFSKCSPTCIKRSKHVFTTQSITRRLHTLHNPKAASPERKEEWLHRKVRPKKGDSASASASDSASVSIGVSIGIIIVYFDELFAKRIILVKMGKSNAEN
ncbi:hypothetical protein PHYBLDRAFT_64307 [Phycomyces blakesleeanus NRRL 1555(-)]|uniref:Uncharacterized protein n=1 Tax=Phycomyces blakesleeanus (strain ATCC 8743b / DSM 1359 / FGSC 10004 / NBRC 33097 / NRRL 1555) TaxID=763407 RepID=A0A162PYD4_PHYB8|nr:hypothetical protein PHYBLDRAFT_64307 [Phycomyces blakesleeanus NRRL 1555(-)]OAD75386.1 hypothetical protein PHYBLDRAFT_64307 [Phycomyces blakesleeanus NRRL 1555(-)]|eukprot:XP_018293426.1 hypothetical protein PHYBLDRAFT_64307 [Phycomyces blakesleeanus NRRL 1555(-)]